MGSLSDEIFKFNYGNRPSSYRLEARRSTFESTTRSVEVNALEPAEIHYRSLRPHIRRSSAVALNAQLSSLMIPNVQIEVTPHLLGYASITMKLETANEVHAVKVHMVFILVANDGYFGMSV